MRFLTLGPQSAMWLRPASSNAGGIAGFFAICRLYPTSILTTRNRDASFGGFSLPDPASGFLAGVLALSALLLGCGGRDLPSPEERLSFANRHHRHRRDLRLVLKNRDLDDQRSPGHRQIRGPLFERDVAPTPGAEPLLFPRRRRPAWVGPALRHQRAGPLAFALGPQEKKKTVCVAIRENDEAAPMRRAQGMFHRLLAAPGVFTP